MKQEEPINHSQSESKDGTGTLVILLHGYKANAGKLLPVENTIRRLWPHAEIFRPELPCSTFSLEDLNDIVARLLTQVDAMYLESRSHTIPFRDIVLVGHSVGGLLARKLYVVACGEVEGAPLEPAFRQNSQDPVPARPWATLVSRIVLLAGMNRGWRLSHHLALKWALRWRFGTMIGRVIELVSRKRLLISQVRRGANFITDLRIQWLLMRRQARSQACDESATSGNGCGKALTIQLLGSRDDMVAPEDNVDLVAGDDFIYLDVPYSGHSDVVEMENSEFGTGRASVFTFALRASQDDLKREAVVPSDEDFIAPVESVKRVIFVIHGIRDVGYWTHKIARRIKQRDSRSGTTWATVTSSYGYFPMLPFLFSVSRRKKVEWLMDQYTEALARYPNASFSYVGHSNGTYLLARALELYPCCRFENVVFAGSVVRTCFDWNRYLSASPPRVNALLNFVATRDWVVAFFPKAFETLNLKTLGSAGHDGFSITQQTPQLYQLRYICGGHSAAIQEDCWDTIADFVITGRAEQHGAAPVENQQSTWVKAIGRCPLVVWVLIILILVAIKVLIVSIVSAAPLPPDWTEFFAGFAVALYIVCIILVLTRA